ncbi:MAG: asparagine synthase-related protein, partial [Nitrosopumilaceae archaeon]
YDIYKKPILPEPTFKDFENTISDVEGVLIEKALRMVIRERLAKFDRICMALSSGIDSVLLLALMRDEFPNKPIRVFTQKGIIDETPDASNHAKRFNADFHSIERNEIVSDIPFMVKLVDEPRWNVYPYIIGHQAKKFGDVLVNGDGADEIFGGYIFRYKLFSSLSGFFPLRYINCHQNDWVQDQNEIFAFDYDFNKEIQYFNRFVHNDMDIYDSFLFADYCGKLLRDYVPMGNWISKFYSIPIISPYMDNRISSIGFHIPFSEKVYNNIGKLQLRNIMKRFGITFPQKKIGHSLDIINEFKMNKHHVMSILLNDDGLMYQYGIISKKWMEKNAEKLEYGYVNKFLQLVALEYWLKNKYKKKC